MAKMIRGIQDKQVVTGGRLMRDTRPMGERFAEWLQEPEGLLTVGAMTLVALFAWPALNELTFLVGLGLLWFAKTRKFMLPFRMPQTSGMLDHNDPKMGSDSEPSSAKGIAFLGNELNTRKELWFKNDDMRTHLLVFGSTGAGKTESLISIAFNALVQGSGFIYVDGKGDSSLFAKVFSMARSMGREDDVLVINYMTGSRDVFGPQANKLSNTMNPFVSGSSGGLTELLVSLMDESGGDNAMWKGRAISLIGSIMMALVDMRERKEILLDVEQIRGYLELNEIIKLSKRRDLPEHVLTALRAYLKSLPGYQDGAQKQSETVLDQHGYLQMQFTKILGSLADSYGYIFKTNMGEVDFWDVVVNRRILVVLLPALEKSPEELANLGKIVVASLKQMMAIGLGSDLEGDYDKIIGRKPTAGPTPFMCILDEYGYYAVKGAAVMPAQARSLGFCMVFAGQDYPAFEKASKEEAASTIANCNIKIFMKLEDPKDTFDLFAKSVGEAYVTHVSGYQANTGSLVTSYSDMQNANVEKRARGELRDLQEQREGEAHIIFKGAVVRAKMFYANPKTAKKLQLNYFLKVEPPEKEELEGMDKGLAELRAKLLDETFMADIEESTEPATDIDLLREVLDAHPKLGFIEQGAAAVAAQQVALSSQLDAFRQQMGHLLSSEDDDEDSIDIFRPPRDERDARAKGAQGRSTTRPGSRYAAPDVDEDEDYGELDHPDADEDFPVFLDQEQTRRNLAKTERLGGETPERAEENANRIIEDMKAVSQYPHEGVPDEKSPDDILEMLKELDDQIDDFEGSK